MIAAVVVAVGAGAWLLGACWGWFAGFRAGVALARANAARAMEIERADRAGIERHRDSLIEALGTRRGAFR
jgi:hypothetical protein